MGSGGYWILIWDNWGGGLTMINPRLLQDGVDLYNNPANWFPSDPNITDFEICQKHCLPIDGNFKIIRG